MTKKDKTLLATIIAAMGNAAAPYHMATNAELAGLLKGGYVEVNSDITDGDKVAVRATEKGTAEMADNTDTSSTAGTTAATAAASYGIIKGAVMPAGRASGDSYPFETMDAGDSFFVANTAERPDAAKSLASTVSSATKRYATEVAGETRVNRKGNTVAKTTNTRVFAVKAVKSGVAYGEWTAPADGALVMGTA